MIIKTFFAVKEKVRAMFVGLGSFVKSLRHKWMK
jgi:hypothetical protein